jgi:AraC family transcriptional regulator
VVHPRATRRPVAANVENTRGSLNDAAGLDVGHRGATTCPAVPSTALNPAEGHGNGAALPERETGSYESARITWIAREDGRERPIPVGAVSARSGSAWAGIRVEETHSAPGELPEGYLPAHVVVLNREPLRSETWWIGDRDRNEITICPNRATVFPAGAPYVTRWRDPADNVMVEISPQLVASVATEGEATEGAQLRPALAADDAFLTHVVLALREAVRGDHPGGPLYGETLGTALAVHLLSRYGVSGPKLGEPRGGLCARDFRRITAYVDEHLGDAITLRALAGVAGMSVYHFARMFKARAGVSPYRYIVRRRVDRAKALLQGTTLPVGDVGMRCGFSHPSHFTSTFQRVLGTTPRRYRQVAASER